MTLSGVRVAEPIVESKVYGRGSSWAACVQPVIRTEFEVIVGPSVDIGGNGDSDGA